ncbi:MAG: hypothetical protein M3P50_09345 [Actinomycetota bacterium]|nr:hypothetical protein [Actinomycetota bacterium]
MTLLLLVLIALEIALCVTGVRLMRDRQPRHDELVPLATVWQISER